MNDFAIPTRRLLSYLTVSIETRLLGLARMKLSEMKGNRDLPFNEETSLVHEGFRQSLRYS